MAPRSLPWGLPTQRRPSPVAGGAGAVETAGLRWRRVTAIAASSAESTHLSLFAKTTLTASARKPPKVGASALTSTRHVLRLSSAPPVVSARGVGSALARAVTLPFVTLHARRRSVTSTRRSAPSWKGGHRRSGISPSALTDGVPKVPKGCSEASGRS